MRAKIAQMLGSWAAIRRRGRRWHIHPIPFERKRTEYRRLILRGVYLENNFILCLGVVILRDENLICGISVALRGALEFPANDDEEFSLWIAMQNAILVPQTVDRIRSAYINASKNYSFVLLRSDFSLAWLRACASQDRASDSTESLVEGPTSLTSVASLS